MSFMTIPDSPFVSGSSFFDQQGLDLNLNSPEIGGRFRA